jgi:hypothetical protein
MEQLIIFLLFVVGSIISSIIQKKKKKAEAEQQQELEELTRRARGEPVPPRKPVDSWPKTAADWQEQLRRMLEGESQPPPVFKPILLPPQERPPQPPVQAKQPPRQIEASEGDLSFKIPRKTSVESYDRAANLYASVKERMRAINSQTSTAHAASTRRRPRAHSAFVQRLKQNPRAIREAFIASVIFAPPKSLEAPGAEQGR